MKNANINDDWEYYTYWRSYEELSEQKKVRGIWARLKADLNCKVIEGIKNAIK